MESERAQLRITVVDDDREHAYVYMMRCNDDSLYTGWTYKLHRRVTAHHKGTASKYTRSRLPLKLAYYERVKGRSEALKREAEIKKMTKAEKEELLHECGFKNVLLDTREEKL